MAAGSHDRSHRQPRVLAGELHKLGVAPWPGFNSSRGSLERSLRFGQPIWIADHDVLDRVTRQRYNVREVLATVRHKHAPGRRLFEG
jgi:hypothetical protein